MTILIIVANIIAKDNCVELVKTELQKLVDVTRAEEGCLQYDLHQDNENPSHFMFYERWATRDLWLVHVENPHLAAYVKATEGAIASSNVQEMTQIA